MNTAWSYTESIKVVKAPNRSTKIFGLLEGLIFDWLIVYRNPKLFFTYFEHTPQITNHVLEMSWDLPISNCTSSISSYINNLDTDSNFECRIFTLGTS